MAASPAHTQLQRISSMTAARQYPTCFPHAQEAFQHHSRNVCPHFHKAHKSHEAAALQGLVQEHVHSRAAHQQLLLVRGAARQRGTLHAQLLQQRQPGKDLTSGQEAVCSC